MAEERVKRRLAAILAADVVGYSRLIEADEEGTRARLRTAHSELIDPRIAADGGRIVKTTGDGILVEFPSAVDAVRNALAIQSAMADHNADLPENQRLVFRVGINLGDIIIEDDDIHGDGVDVPVTTLDRLLHGRQPTLIKIDVEGYEEQVLAGADTTLRSGALMAVTLEAGPYIADGGSRRRGLCATMSRYGFTPADYDPLSRRLTPMQDVDGRSDDIIFVRDLARIGAELNEAPRRKILNTSI